MEDLFQPVGSIIRNVDTQDRVTLPARIASELGSAVVASPGLAGCIELRRPDGWKRYEAQFIAADPTGLDPELAELYRFLIAPAEAVSIDGQGRMRFPEALVRHAGLGGQNKEAQLLKMPDHWEVWDAQRYIELCEARRPALMEIAKRIFGSGGGTASPQM